MLLATHLLLSTSLPFSSTAALSSTPCPFLLLSLYSRMMNNNRGIVAWNTPWKRVPLIYERDHARSLDHHRILFVADAMLTCIRGRTPRARALLRAGEYRKRPDMKAACHNARMLHLPALLPRLTLSPGSYLCATYALWCTGSKTATLSFAVFNPLGTKQ